MTAENDWIDEKPELPPDKGWVNWHGKTEASPVNAECYIELRRRDGGIFRGFAREATWDNRGEFYDAVAYRVLEWVVDPDEIFEHFPDEECPLPYETQVMADQGANRFTLGPAPAGIFGWSVIRRYKILKGG